MNDVYSKLKEFRSKYPLTVGWRLKAHSKVVDIHLNKDEKVLYTFFAQKNDTHFEFFRTFVACLTNRRLIFAQKRLLFGYLFLAITPDMFNDLTVKSDVFWGSINIDTVKEKVILTNIQKSALPEIETEITDYMMKEKRKYNLASKK